MKGAPPKYHGAVIVTRVSTGEQVKYGTSLKDQLETCRAKAAVLCLPIIAEYEDAGVSGAYLLLREGMQLALQDITEGRADTLICANVSRYSRDVEHQQQIKKQVRQAGGRVVFCDINFDDTPEGDLAFDIMGGFAAYERKVIRERTMRGKKKRAQEGQQPARSRSPYGYHIVTHADIVRGDFPPDQLGRYQIDEPNAAIVRRMFEGYATGTYSLPKLARELNQEAVAPPGPGVAWHEATIRVILTNPVYKGQPVSGRIKSYVDESRLTKPHALTGVPITTAEVRYFAPEDQWVRLSSPPIVNEALWDAVQANLRAMQLRHGGNPKRMRMLSGLVFCPYCGARAVTRYQMANGVTYQYYYCGLQSKMKRRTGERPCSPDLYSISTVEEAAIRAVREAYRRPDAIVAALEAYRKRLAEPNDQDNIRRELRALAGTLEKLKAEEVAAIQAQIAGIRAGASAEAYAEVFADIASRRKDLEERRGLLSASLGNTRVGGNSTRPSGVLAAQALKDADQVLSDPDVSGFEKRNLIGIVVEKVLCRKNGADVVFAPSAVLSPDQYQRFRDTFHTTCIGMRTQK